MPETFPITNTLSTRAQRDKYRLASLDHTLRNALVAEAVCAVDRSDAYRIQSPYGSTPTVEISVLTGTYTPANWTTTDDTLTVNAEFKVGEQIYQFENIITQFDLFAARMDQHNYAISLAVDKFVINNLCEDGTTSYSTPAGGFTTASNVNTIIANLVSNVAGYAAQYSDFFLIIENTDLPGFVQAGFTNGFSFADANLKNGWGGNYGGVDVYVVRSGTFSNDTQAGITWTNSGHRCFGVKGVATYAAPRGLQFDEKGVSGKTGKEIMTVGLIGFKLWAVNTALVVDITLV